jgi:pimeloyl-ACP methyl ester carboxylesterase
VGAPMLPPGLPTPTARREVLGPRGRLAVAELGDPGAPAWLVVHGAGSSARFVAAAFAGPVVDAGGRLVVYDLRGHGGSANARQLADHHLDAHVEDLVAVAASTRGPLAVVGGVSLGGHAAVRAVAGGQLDTDVVLACLPAWTGQAVAGVGPHAAIAGVVRDHGVDGLLARTRAAADLPRWLSDTLLTDHVRHDPASLAAALRALDGGEAPSLGEIATLSAPLAVVAWPEDPGHPAEVAGAWAAAASSSALTAIAMDDLEAGVERLGEAAVRSVRGLGIRPDGSREG